MDRLNHWVRVACLVALVSASAPAHADIVMPTAEEMEELRRNGPRSSCPEGSDRSSLPDVECQVAAPCTSDAECAPGDCAPRSLCLAPERDGIGPVLGVCVEGACPFGECDTQRRCSGSARSSVERAQADVEAMLLEALREGDSPAPTPMADPDTELPDPPPPSPAAPPAQVPAPASGCGCRAARDASPSSGLALLLGLFATRSARRRRSRASRRRRAAGARAPSPARSSSARSSAGSA